MPDDFAPRWDRLIDSPLEGFGHRALPRNIMAEQSVIGALMVRPALLDQVAEILRPEHFADPVHGRIFREQSRRISAGGVADAVSLLTWFAADPDADILGGTAYLAHLTTSNIAPMLAVDYAGVIRDTWMQRKMIDLGMQITERGFGGGDAIGPAEQVELAERALADLCSAGRSFGMGHDAAMDSALAAMDRATAGTTGGISTGFSNRDWRLGGLEPGLVYVIGGRTGMGKSAVGHLIALNVARRGIPVLELSLEMSAEQIGRRSLSVASGVGIAALKRGRLSMEEASRVVVARKELSGLPLWIDDAGGQTPGQITTKARAHRRKHGLGLVLLDHLNLLRGESHDTRHGNTQVIEAASHAMKLVAKDCACPVIELVQLNRAVESREDKRPGLQDLRQSGAIEEDADAVGFVYRPEYYLGSEPDPVDGESAGKFEQRRQAWADQKAASAGKAELIWRKVRDGEPGTDYLTFDGPTATFREAEDVKR